MPSTRRAFLVAVAVGAAGCTSRLDDPADDTPPTDVPPTPGEEDDCAAGLQVELGPFAPAADLPMQVGGGTERAVVDAAVADGETTVRRYGEAPLDAGVVAHGGRYYHLTVAESATETVPAYRFDLSWTAGRTAPDDATVLSFESLPESDREAMRFLVPDGEGEEDVGHPENKLSISQRPVPYPDGGPDSELLSRAAVWVRWRDREYRVSTGEETTTERHTYRYRAAQVAADDSGLRSWAASEYLVDLSPSDAQRDLLDRARNDGYGECTPASDPLQALLDALPSDDGLPEPAEGWYVAFDGSRYRLSVLRWVE